jgi:salicylate hydroxylase
MVEPILIIGGGIGGLTAALALLRQGLPVQVYEQARSVGDVGAGLSLGSTSTRGLSSLGLLDSLKETADHSRCLRRIEMSRWAPDRNVTTGQVRGAGGRGALPSRRARPLPSTPPLKLRLCFPSAPVGARGT